MNIFENIVVINEEGTTFDVPIIYGKVEEAASSVSSSEQIRLPLISVDVDNGILFVWTLYKEDMNQIIEQIFTILTDKITSVANNFDLPPEHGRLNLYKFQVNFQM
jgi:hypothetical protein